MFPFNLLSKLINRHSGLAILGDPRLDSINRHFKSMIGLLNICCCFKELPTATGAVLVPASVVTLPGCDKIPLHATYTGM